MSQIFYCDGCGVRLMPQDSPLGIPGTAPGGDILCPKCRAARASEASKLAPPPVLAATRPPTGSVGTHSTHRRPAPAPGTDRQPGSNMIVVASVVAGVLLLGGGTILLLNSKGNAPEPGLRAKAKEEKHDAAVPATPSGPPAATAPAQLRPPQEPSAEERAQDAYAALQKFEGLDPHDAAGKTRRLEAFIELYGDATVTARARVQLAELKRQAPAAERPSATAVTKSTSPAAESEQAALAFKEDFEGTGAACIGFGEVAGQLPGNAPGKALKFLPNHGRDDELRGGFNVDAYAAGARKEQGYLCVLRAEAVLRFRYYAENATELRIRINSKGDKESWMKTLDAIPQRTWTSVSIPLREFKAAGGGADISNGTLCAEFFTTAYGKKGLAVYWDDVEITSPDK